MKYNINRLHFINKNKESNKYKYLYKISVIIPMYNSELYLQECLNSILNQTLFIEDIEIICIDDGSSDDTISICKDFALRHENFIIIKNGHNGVSEARNIGIKNAHGKYITFLDSDDILSPSTLSSLFNYFEKHYEETDIITYDICYLKDNKKIYSKRCNIINHDEVVNLYKNPFICQTSINICIKNNFQNNKLFDKRITQSEDQTYILELCSFKGTIGYCKNALYIYRQHNNSTIKSKGHPYYSYEDMLFVFENWIKKYKTLPIFSYVKCLILYNFNWRLQIDWLFPYHYKNEKYKNAILRFKNIINQINREYIYNNPWISLEHKDFFLSQKTENKPFCIIDYDKLYICDNNGEFFSVNKIYCIINRERIFNTSIYISGFLKSQILNYIPKPNLFIVYNDIKIESISLYKSIDSFFGTKICTNKYWGFSIQIDMHKVKKFFLFVEINGKKFPLQYYFREWNNISSIYRNYIHNTNLYSLYIEKNAFFLESKNNEPLSHKKKKYKNTHKKYIGYFIIKKLSKILFSKKRIWLYSDSPGGLDNAYYQFVHDNKKKDGIDRYYIYHGDRKEFDLLCLQEENIIYFKTSKHRLLFLSCEKILTSFVESRYYIPFIRHIELIIDMMHFKTIYLQHGVMHAYLPTLYAKDKSFFIDKIVISTFFEKRIIINNYHYKREDIIESGMPRFSIIKKEKEAYEEEKRILFAPSWRYYLVSQDNSKGWLPRTDFKESKYYKEINLFLKNENMLSFLKEKQIYIDFKLHPIFSMYKESFNFENQYIQAIEKVDIKKYKLFITDFSSYMYDFIYLDKPLLLFIPDREKVDAGLHTYRKFCIPIEKSYGDYCEDYLVLINNIKHYVINNFTLKDIYKEKYHKTFICKDVDHSEILYNNLIKI